MKLKLINNTSYKDIRVELDSIEYYLKKGENVFDVSSSDFQLKINVYDKSTVYFWSMLLCSVLFFDFILGDEIGSANFVCNSNYFLSSNRDECVVVLSKVSVDKRGVSHSSVFANTYAQINEVKHTLNENVKVKKKFVKRNVQLLMLIAILLIPFFLWDGKVGFGVGLFSLFFSVPCIIRLISLKKIFSDKYITDKLNKQIVKELRKQ